MIIRFYRILFGFLRVRFTGDFKEKILSLCAQNGITLWGTRLKGDAIESSISVSDFKYLRNLARGRGVRIHIVKKIGIPFITNRYKRRYGILAGAIAFFLVLGIMSEYIWIIDVNGNHRIKDKEIISACESIGITEGIKKKSIYPKLEREKLMLRLDGIAWASLNIEGSRLTVNVTETKEKNEESKSFSNLKADADGIIKKLDIVSGTSVVKVGQAVKKGDLLVSGIIETTTGTRFVKSKGEVVALSQNEISFFEEYEQEPLIPTGKVKTKNVLEIFGLKIPLFLGEESGSFKSTQSNSTLNLFGANLPVKIHSKTFKFNRKTKIKYNYEKLCVRLEKQLENELEGQEGAEVLKKEFKEEEKGVRLSAIIGKEENIAVNDILLINTGN